MALQPVTNFSGQVSVKFKQYFQHIAFFYASQHGIKSDLSQGQRISLKKTPTIDNHIQ